MNVNAFFLCKTYELSCRLREYIEENEPNDPLIHSRDKKQNPWAEKGKCECKHSKLHLFHN